MLIVWLIDLLQGFNFNSVSTHYVLSIKTSTDASMCAPGTGSHYDINCLIYLNYMQTNYIKQSESIILFCLSKTWFLYIV